MQIRWFTIIKMQLKISKVVSDPPPIHMVRETGHSSQPDQPETLRKLHHGPGRPWQYIPDFNWRAVRENMGPSKLYDHLVPQDTSEGGGAQQDASGSQSLVQIVCRVLDLKVEDVSAEVPLTAYGLDSLSAASLSYSLRPLLAVLQI
ncbi:hypothetical protein LXA43DRAFT_1100677 [Ganoderma leucocontextum]|nr:hypothetical protein LXA43DRAFT_1100677 [Ganoderma leucocontextum]